MHTALAYLLTAPVINPVVILSTALAFQWNWDVVFLRVVCTFAIGASIAYFGGYLFNIRQFTSSGLHPDEEENFEISVISLYQLLLHAGDEFFDIGRYLIISAFLAAAIQVWVPKGALFQVAGAPYLATAVTMILAISMSLCSEADAFVARALANQFPLGSIMAFLVIGQIIDLRNIMLFSRNFKFFLFLFLLFSSIGLTYLLGVSIDSGWWMHLFELLSKYL